MQKISIFILSLILILIISLQKISHGALPEGAMARLGKGRINGITYSPDGMQLVVASSVGIWRYDATTGNELPMFTEYTGFALSTAYSPDGGVLASGSEDDTLRLWNAITGEPITILPGHTDRIATVVYSLDGKTIASGSWDNTVRLWDAATNQLKKVFAGHSRWVASVAYSPDGKQVASGSDDTTVRLWDVETGQSTSLTMHTGGVTAVAYSPDGGVLASGAKDDTVRLWNANTGQRIATLTGHTGDVTAVVYSPDGKTIASGSADGTVRLWDPITGQLKTTLTGHSRSVVAVTYSSSGALASGSADGTVRIWNTATGQPIVTIAGHINSVISIAYSSGGRLASGSEDGAVRVWEPSTGEMLTKFNAHPERVESLAYSPDGSKLVTAGGVGDRTARLWDAAIGNSLATLTGHTAPVFSVAYSPDGSTVATGSSFGDNTVRLWDAATGQHKDTLKGHTRPVQSVAYSRNGGLASGSRDGTARLWDTATGGHTTLIGHTDRVNSVAYSSDGSTLASGSRDSTVRLWDLTTRQLKATLIGHAFGVRFVTFSPDGSTVVSAGDDGMVRLWDVVTGHSITALTGHTHRVRAVAFSPDGGILASGSEDGTVLLWDFTLLRAQEAELQAAVSQLQEQGSDLPKVQLIYFHPNDRAPQDITAQVDRVVKDVQLFYARQIKNYGFGIKTFILETDVTDKVLVHRVEGRFPETHYRDQPYSKILEEIDEQFDRSQNIILLFLEGSEDILGVNICGLGGVHRSGGGTAMLPAAGDCFSFRIVAHELGHAFGLYHDFREPNLMSHSSGYLAQLTTCFAEALVVHPLFGTSQNDITPTTIQLRPPVVSSSGLVQLRFDLTDTDGLHQAQLITPGTPQDPIQGVKLLGCQRLSGERETVEFTVSKSIFTLEDVVGIRVLDVRGGVAQQWHRDVLDTRAHLDVNNDGVLNILDLVSVASHFGQTGASIRGDVNGDGVVNILDLVLVVGGIDGGISAAPSAGHRASEGTPTRAEIEAWLTQAQRLAPTDAILQRGIAVLEQLLALLTPERTALLPNYPNPFNPETWIPYQLAAPTDVTLHIYSATGTVVRILALGYQPAGWYQTRDRAAYWDGMNDLNEPVASGVYFYTLTAGDFTATRKMLILK